jgi:hypothetical protein
MAVVQRASTSKSRSMIAISFPCCFSALTPTHLPPDTVKMGFPVRVMRTSELMLRRQTLETFDNWAVNGAPERAQWRGKAMFAAFNGCKCGGMQLSSVASRTEVGPGATISRAITPRPELREARASRIPQSQLNTTLPFSPCTSL